MSHKNIAAARPVSVRIREARQQGGRAAWTAARALAAAGAPRRQHIYWNFYLIEILSTMFRLDFTIA